MKHISKKRLAILLVSIVALLTVTVGGTLAYVYMSTNSLKNEFTPSKVDCQVVENVDPDTTQSVDEGQVKDVVTKSDVKIKNTGDTDAYIRVAVVVTWKDSDGNVYAQKPVAGIDYTEWDETLTNGWICDSKDGYYYYSQPVSPNALTLDLIDKIEVLDTAEVPEGYSLSVEIVASAIQSTPETAVENAWNVIVTEGILNPNPNSNGGT